MISFSDHTFPAHTQMCHFDCLAFIFFIFLILPLPPTNHCSLFISIKAVDLRADRASVTGSLPAWLATAQVCTNQHCPLLVDIPSIASAPNRACFSSWGKWCSGAGGAQRPPTMTEATPAGHRTVKQPVFGSCR